MHVVGKIIELNMDFARAPSDYAGRGAGARYGFADCWEPPLLLSSLWRMQFRKVLDV